MWTPILIIGGTLIACLLLLADNKKSNARHDAWRRTHGFPPYRESIKDDSDPTIATSPNGDVWTTRKPEEKGLEE